MADERKYDLTKLTEVYKDIYYSKGKTYVLVKDGVHYPIHADRLEGMKKECMGHTDEIASMFKGRKKRDPNAPKPEKKPKKFTTIPADPEGPRVTGTGGWLDPELRDPKDKIYDAYGFKYRHIIEAEAKDRYEEALRPPTQPPIMKVKGNPPAKKKAAKKEVVGKKNVVKKPVKKNVVKKPVRRKKA